MIALALWILTGAVVGPLVGRVIRCGTVDQVAEEIAP